MKNTGFLKAFWALAKPYWVSEQRAKGWTLLGMVVGLALMLEHVPQVEAEVRVGGFPADGLVDQFDGIADMPTLKGNHSQQVQRLGVIGRRLEDVPIDLLRFRESPGKVMFLRSLNRLCERLVVVAHTGTRAVETEWIAAYFAGFWRNVARQQSQQK